MKIILGFIVITVGFYVSLEHLNQGIKQFWDVIAFAMVVFGTIAVSIMTIPSLRIRHTFLIMKRGLASNHGLREDAIANAVNVMQGKTPTATAERIDQKILVDGLELMRLGFSTDKIRDLLLDRIEKYTDDVMTVAQWVRALSKYPPAFGLAGTVLGLIHLMKGLSEGTDPKETGLRMAIALVATFYGIVVANVFVNPIGDRIMSNAKEDQNLAEISLNAILMMSERVNYIEMLEQMNNYIPGQSRKLSLTDSFSEAS
jgi:chemotaxis protein MotA